MLIVKCREIDKDHALRETMGDRFRDGDRQSGFAGAGGTGQSQHSATSRAKEIGDAVDIVRATDERREALRKCGSWGRAHRVVGSTSEQEDRIGALASIAFRIYRTECLTFEW